MSTQPNVIPIEVTDKGVLKTVTLNSSCNCYELYTTAGATVRMMGASNIAPEGTPSDMMTVLFKITGNIILNGRDFTVFGKQITAAELLNKSTIECIYDAEISDWIINVYTPNMNGDLYKVLADSTDTVAGYLSTKVAKSIVENPTTHKIELDGDVLAPGLNYYYGTNAAGVKGLYPLASGISNLFGEFYGLTAGIGNATTTDYAATVAVGAAFPFPRDGYANGIVRSGPSTFLLPSAGKYKVTFECHTTEPGQLQLVVAGVVIFKSTAMNYNPTSGGHSIQGTCIVDAATATTLQVINPAGNSTALTVTPSDGALTYCNPQRLLIEKIM